MADFNKIGLLVVRDDSFLLCRKHDYTSKLIMPGGQIEDGESALDCLIREVQEELGNDVIVENPTYFGTYIDKAASDDPTLNKTVEIQLYKGDIRGRATPSSEVKELIWFGKESNPYELSSIIANKILPDLLKRGILNWKK